MGYYIEGPTRGKADFICKTFGARIANGAVTPGLDGIIVVLDNGLFEAACFCHNAAEFERCVDVNDDRPKTILIGDYNTLAEAAGYLVAEDD